MKILTVSKLTSQHEYVQPASTLIIVSFLDMPLRSMKAWMLPCQQRMPGDRVTELCGSEAQGLALRDSDALGGTMFIRGPLGPAFSFAATHLCEAITWSSTADRAAPAPSLSPSASDRCD